jgi:antitoxin (DNA-binding transcriptional repressor) of toxin-antitoxin stability system
MSERTKMTETVPIEEAQNHLAELIARLIPGEEIVITHNDKPVAKLHMLFTNKPQPRFGNCHGKLIILAEEDEHLTDI